MRRAIIVLVLVAVVTSSHVPWSKPNKCDDPQYSCPSSSTCCKMNDGTYGCCPIKNAVCCTDHLHCCPSGTQCDVEEGRCIQGSKFTPIYRKHSSYRTPKNDDVMCPDKKAKCPAGTTCCQLAQGSFGCCPVPDAVCCSDKMHCCPNGYICDTTGARCINKEKNEVTTWFRKFVATPLKSKKGTKLRSFENVEDFEEEEEEEGAASVSCGLTRCPARSTCCATEGMFGRTKFMCCPLSKGICCDRFCCPSGFECAGEGRCERKAHHPFN